MTITTGYIIDASPTINGVMGSNIQNAFDGNTSTYGEAYTWFVSAYIIGRTTNISEISGESITSIRVRFKAHLGVDYNTGYAAIYTQGLGELLGTASSNIVAISYSDWTSLSIPTGGWTWDKVANLETKLYRDGYISEGDDWYAVEIEVTSESSGPETKTSVGSANARISVITESDGSLNARINIVTESVGSFNARIYIAEINETSIDVTLKASTNKNIQLKSSTNQVIKLKSSTNKNIILK